MKCQSAVCLLALVSLSLLVGDSNSLPPDFFRAGRDRQQKQLRRSSSATDDDVISAVCSFCGAFSTTSEATCQSGAGDTRRDCALALLTELENALLQKTW